MLRWTWKSLIGNRGSLWGSAAGVACAFVLVMTFQAIFVGESTQIVAYLRHTNPSVWVMQRGVSNMHMAYSFIWDWKAEQVAEIEGVSKVTPLLYLNTVINAGDRDWFCYVVGLESGQTRGGPWALTKGRGDPDQGEAVIPSVLAKMANVDVGDTISITDKKLKVIGLSSGTFSMANSVTFVHFSDLQDVLSSFGTYSYLLVDAEPGVDPNVLASRIEQSVEKVSALPQDAFVRSDFQLAMQMGVEIVALMSVICTILAVLIIAFTTYTFVARKRSELAMTKALGVTNRAVYTSVMLQSIVITVLGFVLAVLVAYGVMPHVSKIAPQVTLVIELEAIARIGLIALLTAIVAALVPAHYVARLDPMTVFKA